MRELMSAVPSDRIGIFIPLERKIADPISIFTSLSGTRISVSVHRGGHYRIAVRWSPYWTVTGGCLSAGKDGMMRLWTRGPRAVQLAFDLSVGRALDTLAGEQPRCRLP